MLRPRVIPCLLLKEEKLVKTVKFKNPRYIGDPTHRMKIFNDKYVDEIIFMDIGATVQGYPPQLDVIKDIASECFMPACYGGGVRTIDGIKNILNLGIEKVSISSYAVENPDFIELACREFGSQSIVASIDVKKNFTNKYEVVTHNATVKTGLDPLTLAIKMEEMGAGELLINSVDRDGMMEGFDVDLISKITGRLNLPVIACGGAGKLDDIRDVIIKGGASAAAVGSLFVFHGKLRAVLINYPTQEELESLFS